MWTRFACNEAGFQCTLSCGPAGKGHYGWRGQSAKLFLVTTLDLKAVYRQLPISPESRPYAVIVVPRPDGKGVSLLEGKALPFGAVPLCFTSTEWLGCCVGLDLIEFLRRFFLLWHLAALPRNLCSELLGFKYFRRQAVGFQAARFRAWHRSRLLKMEG